MFLRRGSRPSCSALLDRGIEAKLRNVLRGDHGAHGTRSAMSPLSVTHLDRRLHHMMFANRDDERIASSGGEATSSKVALVSIQSWRECGYSLVSVQCRDCPKLLFDVVCTLMDMEYIVFHGIIDTFTPTMPGQETRVLDPPPYPNPTNSRSEGHRNGATSCSDAARCILDR